MNKDYVENDPEEEGLSDFSRQKIAEVIWQYGKLASIIFLENGLITYGELLLTKSGTWLSIKYKDGVEISRDEYTPKGIIHEDLTEEWKLNTKGRY